MAKKDLDTKILHPMESFGSVSGLTEGIRINRLEDRLHPAVPFPHKHDFYQILLVKKGSGIHEIDFVRYPITKHSAFVMRPAEVHSWQLDKSSTGLVLEFPSVTLISKDLRWQRLKSILDKLPAAPTLSPETFARLHALISQSLLEFQSADSNSQLVLLGHLMECLILLSRPSLDLNALEESTSELSETFTQLLEKNFKTEHRVEFYAEAMNLTAKALTMRFSRLGLKSPRELVQDRCILEAKRLLVYSKYSIQDIAERLGFEDANYFARFFRKKAGSSPGDFRRNAGSLC